MLHNQMSIDVENSVHPQPDLHLKSDSVRFFTSSKTHLVGLADPRSEYTQKSIIRQVQYVDIDMTKTDPRSFEVRLRRARLELRKINQSELATLAGIPATSIAHFEGGSRRPSFDSLRKIAGALNVTTDYLLGRTEEPNMTKDEDPLYRYSANLTNRDRELVQAFIQMLEQRQANSTTSSR